MDWQAILIAIAFSIVGVIIMAIKDGDNIIHALIDFFREWITVVLKVIPGLIVLFGIIIILGWSLGFY